MKKVSDIFRKKGFAYHKHKREGNVAIYLQYDERNNNQFVAAEVVVINKQPKDWKTGNGTVIANKGDEIYPGDAHFGYTGFSYRSFDGNIPKQAYNKFNQLLSENN